MKKALLALLPALFTQQTHAMEIAIIPREMRDVFRSGQFEWLDIVRFLFHLIELLLTVAGSIAVILIMIGGFQYIFGSMSGSKEKGATTLKNAVTGFIVILSAWIIVDFITTLFTTS